MWAGLRKGGGEDTQKNNEKNEKCLQAAHAKSG